VVKEGETGGGGYGFPGIGRNSPGGEKAFMAALKGKEDAVDKFFSLPGGKERNLGLTIQGPWRKRGLAAGLPGGKEEKKVFPRIPGLSQKLKGKNEEKIPSAGRGGT